MTRDAARALATALLAAMSGAALAAVFYAARPALDLDFTADPPRLVTGLFPVERDNAARTTFVWTRDEVTIRLPNLDRHVTWTLALHVRGGRPGDNPTLAVFADGLPAGSAPTGADFRDVRFEIPAHPDGRRGGVVSIHVSSTFVPGPSDPRALGVMLDRLTLTPSSVVIAPRPAIAGAALSSAVMGAAIALVGVTAGSAVVGAAIVSAGIAVTLTSGFAPYTAFPATAISLSLWIGILLVVLSWTTRRLAGADLRNTGKFAAIFSAAALLLKLLVLLHPDMPVGDAMFHAHRFQGVLRGNLVFTSTAPGGYLFPYAPGFYVFAAIFAPLVARGNADMALLRIVATSVDAVAAILLYRVVVRGWNDRLAGAMAVALYHLTPLDFGVLVTGNLTNAFAEALTVPAMALIAARDVRIERWAPTALLAAVLTAAYLSHTSTLAILFVAALACAALFRLRGGPALRSPAYAIAVAAIAAAVVAVALYYGRFADTYRTEFARIGRETATAAAAPGGRSIGDRLAAVPWGLRTTLGMPVLALALAGAWWQYARAAADRLSLTVAGWVLACAAFLVLGVLTPVDMRYYLASIPAVALLAGRGGAQAWNGGTAWRAAAVAGLGWAVLAGVQTWWDALA